MVISYVNVVFLFQKYLIMGLFVVAKKDPERCICTDGIYKQEKLVGVGWLGLCPHPIPPVLLNVLPECWEFIGREARRNLSVPDQEIRGFDKKSPSGPQ